MEKINWKKTEIIPPSSGVGRMSDRTADTIKELSTLEVNDVVHIPISQAVIGKEMQQKVQSRLVGSIDTAKKALPTRKFKVARRGVDIYVQRLE